MSPPQSRRALLAGGAATLASLAGCSALTGSEPTGSPTETLTSAPTTPSPTPAPPDTLAVHAAELGGVVSRAASAWNANEVEYGTEFDGRLADGFAARHGLDPTDEASNPPFSVATARAAPDAVANGLAEDHLDLAGTGPYPPTELYDGDADPGRFTATPVAVGGWKFVLSPPLADAGVSTLTAESVRRLYTGEIENWRAVGGPDRDPHVVGVADSNGRMRVKETFFEGRALRGLDARHGQERSRLEAVAQRDDAIAFLRAGVPTRRVHVPSLTVDGTAYRPHEEGYPSTYTATLHSWGDPDPREAAFLAFLRSEFGQEWFVGSEWDLLGLGGE